MARTTEIIRSRAQCATEPKTERLAARRRYHAGSRAHTGSRIDCGRRLLLVHFLYNFEVDSQYHFHTGWLAKQVLHLLSPRADRIRRCSCWKRRRCQQIAGRHLGHDRAVARYERRLGDDFRRPPRRQGSPHHSSPRSRRSMRPCSRTFRPIRRTIRRRPTVCRPECRASWASLTPSKSCTRPAWSP